MSETQRSLAPALIVLITAAWVTEPLAQTGAPTIHHYGNGENVDHRTLPKSKLRLQLENLPTEARESALNRLKNISFNSLELNSINVNEFGEPYFSCAMPRRQLESAANHAKAHQVAENSTQNAFALHSRRNSTKRVYLDFDGHTFSNTAWSSGTIVAKAYSLDGDYTNFNAIERQNIIEIWQRVSEDFAQFDIDVTTEAPAVFNRLTGRILFTESTSANGGSMPSGGSGGVAFVDVFGLDNYHTRFSPALVYVDNLSYYTSEMAETASHEFGHNLGLSHDGLGTLEYHPGVGSGHTSWGPIMGSAWEASVTQWSRGDYANSTQTQDDLSIIAAELSYRPDDSGSSLPNTLPLVVQSGGSISHTSPSSDPESLIPGNKGVISSSPDIDAFAFCSSGGQVNLSILPAWVSLPPTAPRGANLDVLAQLGDSAGLIISQSDPLNDTQASISAQLPAGPYQLVVRGIGNASTPYSSYGSTGQYFIAGSGAFAKSPDGADFSIRQTIGLTEPPLELDSGDVDLNGFLDIVSSNFSGRRIMLAYQNSGGFQVSFISTGGDQPATIRLADLNGDSRPDIVYSDFGGNNIGVLLANAGGFGAIQSYVTGSRPYGVDLVDLNGDGRLDIVTANRNSDTISVLIGLSDGTFAAQVTYPAERAPYGVAHGDFNGDGVPDIVVTNDTGNKISVYLGQGDGALGSQTGYITGSEPRGVATGDINADGRVDIVTANSAVDTVSIFLGVGNGTFNPGYQLAAGADPRNVAIADLNFDTIKDVLVTNGGSVFMTALLGTSCGTLATGHQIATTAASAGLTLADFDGDGKRDLIVSSQNPYSIEILRDQHALLEDGFEDP